MYVTEGHAIQKRTLNGLFQVKHIVKAYSLVTNIDMMYFEDTA